MDFMYPLAYFSRLVASLLPRISTFYSLSVQRRIQIVFLLFGTCDASAGG